MNHSLVALFDFFKKIDNKYVEPEAYVGHVPPKPIPQSKPTGWQEGLWDIADNLKAPVATATTNVELSTQLNERSIMNYIAIIQTLIATVKAVEELMPNGSGKDKLAAVLATVSGIFNEVVGILPQLTTVISVIVAGFNASGLFKKTAVAA